MESAHKIIKLFGATLGLVSQVKDLGDAESVLEVKDLVRLDEVFAVDF